MLSATFEILWVNRVGFASGLFVTLKLAAFIWAVGIAGGILLGAIADKLPRTVGIVVRGVSAFFSAVPALVLLFWAYFPLQMILAVDIDPFWTAAGTLALLNLISVADIVRGQLTDFPNQYRDAAKVCGLSPLRTFFSIEFPLVIRQSVPALLLLQVTMLHLTLFASLISVEDVFRVAQRLNSTLYRPIEIYSAVAFLFIAISLPLQLFAAHVQRRIGLTLRER